MSDLDIPNYGGRQKMGRFMNLALRFTPEEHKTMIELKNKLNLTWEELFLFLVDDFNSKGAKNEKK